MVGNPYAAYLSACLGYYPFLLCRRVPGYFGGVYRNYKWRNHAARYSIQDKNGGSSDRPLHLPQAEANSTSSSGTAAAPLLIKDEEEDQPGGNP